MSIWTTPERIALRDTVTGFVQRDILPSLTDWERDGELPRDLHKKAAALGFLGAGFPETVGGSGGDAADVLGCQCHKGKKGRRGVGNGM